MKKIVIIVALVCGAWQQADAQYVSKVWVSDQKDGTYINPIIHADYSDPDVIRVGEKYYMICSDFHYLGMQVLESDDMVFCGRQAIDGDTAQVGPQIAEKLGIPQVSYAAEITKEGKTLTIKRMLEDGYMTIKVNTPCLITCIKELNEPRYMSVGGIFECYEKPYEVLDYNALKDDPLIDPATIGLKGSPTNILTSFTPPQKGAGMMLEGADKATCEKLAGILAGKHLI